MKTRARNLIALAAGIATNCVFALPSRGAQIWTDANGDGLPDAGPPIVAVQGDVVEVDVWIDSDGFQWTFYRARVGWPLGCISYDSAEYVISGGFNYSIDTDFPSSIAFIGEEYNNSGVELIGRLRVRLDSPTACCVSPHTDDYYGSKIAGPTGYRLFESSGNSCWEPSPVGVSGACCFLKERICYVTNAAACDEAGGVYLGDNTSCATDTCPPLPTGACCFLSPPSCQEKSALQCAIAQGTYLGDGTSCATDTCPPPPPPPLPRGACCFGDSCASSLTRTTCVTNGGTYLGDDTNCYSPTTCTDPRPPCPPASAPGVAGAFPLKESGGVAEARMAQSGSRCALGASTNGTAANYRWFNVCSGYIWVYGGHEAGEGVGVLFGGPSQPAVNGDNDVKRVITYFRNVCPGYSQTVDVFVDTDTEGDGCPDVNLGSDLNVDPGIRWNCSDFNVSMPCATNNVIVRTVHDGGTSPSFATDGPLTQICDPNAPARSYYYGVNASACIPWRGPDGTFDNFIYWLILDASAPCINAVEPMSWGKIKGLYR